MNLDAIGIVSSHLEKTVDFFKLLGIELKEAGGPDHLECKTQNGTRIMVDSEKLIRELNPNWKKPAGTRIILCFKQDKPTQVDEIYNQLTAAGHRSIKEPWDAFWGQRYASIEGPDEISVDLFAEL